MSSIRISPVELRELLDEARQFGKAEETSINKWMSRSWDDVRDKWIKSKLECHHRLNKHFQCEVLGAHEYHGAYMGSPVIWVDWDNNGKNPSDSSLPAGVSREYYQKYKDTEIGKKWL